MIKFSKSVKSQEQRKKEIDIYEAKKEIIERLEASARAGKDN